MQEKKIGLKLRCLNNIITRYIENNMDGKMPDDISWANSWIIGYIASHSDRDVFQKELESVCGVTRSTISKVVDLLVKKGYLCRHSVARDARLRKLALTPKALEISKLMEQDSITTEAVLTSGFSDEELGNLCSYIEKMRENILNSGRDTLD